MADVRPVTADRFDEVHPLLLGFANPVMTRDDWRRMLFDLPWPVEEPHRGYVLEDGGRIVGFLGTIFSTRRIEGARRRFCNLSSWIVKPEHRASSLRLVLPVLAMKDCTIVNLSASETAHAVFRKLGFLPLEERQVLLPTWPQPGELLRRPCEVVTDRERMADRLGPEGRAIAEHMRATHAAQTVVGSDGRWCHVVATRSPWKPGRFLAHVQYASDWEVFWRHPGRIARVLATLLGTSGVRVDRRWTGERRPTLAVERPLERSSLYRPSDPAILPTHVDGLYTEAVGQRW